MYPFWEIAIAPVLDAVRAKRVVEIGALRGDTTVLMLERLGPDAEYHVIDPLPDFDPGEHERRFPGRYVFHRDISHNVLPTLEPVDVALIDGDHNWFTVYHELRMLAERSADAGEPLPVMVMHDVCWPYGRRDLYYAPERIPDEFRQPWERKGMRPGHRKLINGGMNAALANAVKEGGPRNGVMTALDDFIAEHPGPLRRVVLPVYFGLAIVADEQRLARHPELAALLDHLESADGRAAMAAMAEDVRLDAAIWDQNVFKHFEGKIARGAQRYLDLLKGALLDEHYLENELRLAYLADCVEHSRPVAAHVLRDPAHHQSWAAERLRNGRRTGALRDDQGDAAWFPFTAMGRNRIDHLQRCLDTIVADNVPGDLAECGVGRGGGAVFLRGYLEAHEIADRQVFVADRFRASPDGPAPAQPPAVPSPVEDLLADLTQVRQAFERFDLLDGQVRFLPGELADSLAADAPIERLALLRLGGGLGDTAGVVLDRLYDKVAPGGFVVVEDLDEPAYRKAVEAFRARRGITAPVERVDWVTTCWRRSADDPPASAAGATGAAPAVTASSAVPARAPLAPPAPRDAVDLSVVVVFHNMRREAQRTLHSLSRAYQRDLDGVSYEVVVVDNGSRPEQRLGEELVASFGPELRYVDLGPDAPSTPTVALNHGIALARGRNIALMIDGAHVLTPGVLRNGLRGLAAYEPAIVMTQQWYVGPGQQPDVVREGYGQDMEDGLFDQIEWPADGYRLFDIGHLIGDRDWLDGMLESNCIFAPRALLEQVGAFDDSFSMPGGGFANLELYERLGESPGVTVATILGEGSFHQVHGGTTTNHADPEERHRNLVTYSEHYQQLRGRTISGPLKHMHYVGGFQSGKAIRTRARRQVADTFNKFPVKTGPDGLPSAPAPIPDELRAAFTEAFWRSLAWTTTTWLGQRLDKAPTDLVAYQELLATVRPDWVVETGTGNGGRAMFLASVCELLGHGQVVSVGARPGAGLPRHTRLTYVEHPAHEESAAAEVRGLVGDGGRGLVVLGSRSKRMRTSIEFRLYAPLVPVGSYVIVEDTVVNGRPVWPGFGPGPSEAVQQILSANPGFVADPAPERFGLTFNPGGYLKRVS